MATIDLTPIEATQESVRPFGELIVPDAREHPALDLARGTPRFYIMRLTARPLWFSAITRHRHVTQCLGAVGGQSWLMGLAPPRDPDDPNAAPKREEIVALRISGPAILRLHRGAWHAGPHFHGQAMDFFNLELADTNDIDHHTVELGATFRFAD